MPKDPDPLAALTHAYAAGHITDAEFRLESTRLSLAAIDATELADTQAAYRWHRRRRVLLLTAVIVLGLACWDLADDHMRVAVAEAGWSVALAAWAGALRMLGDNHQMLARLDAALRRTAATAGSDR